MSSHNYFIDTINEVTQSASIIFDSQEQSTNITFSFDIKQSEAIEQSTYINDKILLQIKSMKVLNKYKIPNLFLTKIKFRKARRNIEYSN